MRDSDEPEKEEVGTEIRQEGSGAGDHGFQPTQAQEVTETRKGDPHQADSTDMAPKLPRKRSSSRQVSEPGWYQSFQENINDRIRWSSTLRILRGGGRGGAFSQEICLNHFSTFQVEKICFQTSTFPKIDQKTSQQDVSKMKSIGHLVCLNVLKKILRQLRERLRLNP